MRITIIIEEGGQAAPVVTLQGTGARAGDALANVEVSQAQMGLRRPGPALDGGPAPVRAGDSAGPTAQDQGLGTAQAAGQALDAGPPPEPMPMGADRPATGPGATTSLGVDAGDAPPLMGAGSAPPTL